MESRYKSTLETPPSYLDHEAALLEQREEWLEGIKHGQLSRERQAMCNIDFLLDVRVEYMEEVHG